MADSTQAQTTDNTQSAGGQQAAAVQAQAAPEKTFTQKELDAILADRLARQKSQFADYDELKKKVEDADAASKSELEKAVERAAKAEADAKKAQAEMKRTTLLADAKVAALALKFKADKIERVLKLVDITDESTNESVKSALETLATEMPELLEGKPAAVTTGAVNPSKAQSAQSGETDAQRMARIRGGSSYTDWLGRGGVEFNPAVNPKQQ